MTAACLMNTLKCLSNVIFIVVGQKDSALLEPFLLLMKPCLERVKNSQFIFRVIYQSHLRLAASIYFRNWVNLSIVTDSFSATIKRALKSTDLVWHSNGLSFVSFNCTNGNKGTTKCVERKKKIAEHWKHSYFLSTTIMRTTEEPYEFGSWLL